jgi:hypothetical protein
MWMGKCGQCSDMLLAGWSRVQAPVGVWFSRPIQTSPEAHPVTCTLGVLRKPLIQNPTSTVNTVLAICVLHNFLLSAQGLRSTAWITWYRKYRQSWSAVWYVERRRDAINKLGAVTKMTSPQRTTVPGMTSQGVISWQYEHICSRSCNTYIFCPTNCLLHHCDSIQWM